MPTMRSALVLLTVLLATGPCSAQQVIHVQLRRGLPYAHAEIDGKHVVVVLDSGTGGVAVDDGFARAAGLHIGRSLGQADGGGSGGQTVRTLQLQSVRFGPVLLRDVPAVAMNLRPLFTDTGVPFAALVGYPLFERRAVTINYPKSEVVTYPKGMSPPCRAPIPISGFVGQAPVVDARIQFFGSPRIYTAHLIVDTGTIGGAAVTLGRRFLHVKTLQPILSQKPVAGGNGTGGKVLSWHTRLDQLDIGSQHFRDVPVGLTNQVGAFNAKQAQGSLGIGLWKSGSITLDYPHKQICIDARAGSPARHGHP